jgi:putative phage-type endonuclease
VTLIEQPDLIQGSEEWLEQRRGMVTASVVGKLVTPSTIKPAKNDDSRALTAQLVAERITGYVDPVYVNADMQRGHDIEPIARDRYAEEFNQPVRESGFLIRREDTWTLGYSPDGLVGDDGLIEVKAPRAKTHLRTILSGEVPAYHMPQIQAGLLVTGREWLDFISYVGGMPMFVRRVEPDERWHKAITAAVEQFEETAAQMVADYQAATAGLPMTERVDFDAEIQVAA